MVAEAAPQRTFKAVPMESLPPEAQSDTAPKRRGRPPKDPNAPVVRRGPRRSKSLETQIGGMLMTFNFAFMVVPPLRQDALDPAEIAVLAKAIDEQARQSPTFRKYLEGMLAVTSGGQLVSVCAIIGARRLARHEIGLPSEADAMLGQMLETMSSAPSITPVPDAPTDNNEDGNNTD